MIDESSVAGVAAVHPGEVLGRDFLEPLDISPNRLAKAIDVPPRRTTADTALRRSRYFGTTDRFWLNLQTRFDLETQRGREAHTPLLGPPIGSPRWRPYIRSNMCPSNAGRSRPE